ncbi:hypothetical protein A605_10750 [Corynebacterium halotolerans YIM 70093 = DSM 44683]|uniref:DUF306 domain-containing protein n=1 Tax=Corynebacterium halotolerans YIM 70093 = DSM 44683 TaxID=1121362 RepID=M1P051_9CORY|nr:hypothetical protein A605_10750 [Corynebacterium halotolerans YIM 70093 = DSM 44683]
MAVGAAAGALLLCGCDSPPGEDAPDPEGTWGSREPGHPELTLEADGRAHGTDGCNQFTGSWYLADTEITFVDMTSTLMACENVDDWFADAATATIDDDTMHCFDAAGREIGTLPRQG